MKKTDIVLFEANGNVEGASPTLRQCTVTSFALKALEAYLAGKGYSVKIIIQNYYTKKDMITKILSLNPSIVGATATTCEIPITAKIMKGVKKSNSRIVTVIGGYHVSACPETIDPHYAKTHGVDPSGIDLLVLGEGEITLNVIANKVIRQKCFGNLRSTIGIAFYCNGKVIKTRSRERIKNLNLLPKVNWTKKDLSLNSFNGMIHRPGKGNVITLASERGCPFNCNFCSTKSTYGNLVVAQPINSLVNEIEFRVREQGVNIIVDFAPTANRNHERLHEFCREIRKRKLRKEISLYMLWRLQSPKGKFMVSENLVKDLMETVSGLKIGFGIEALSEKDEKFLEKNRSAEYIALTSKWFDKYGALMRGFHMITPETDEMSIANCETTKLISYFDDLRITYLTPFPGTPLDATLKNCLLTKNWNNYNCEQPVIQSTHLEGGKLLKAQNTILQNFLKNPYRQKRILKKIAAHPHLYSCFNDYNEKMKSFGFTTQSF